MKGVGHERVSGSGGRIAARAVEQDLRELFADESRNLVCAIVVGAPGNGVRTLIRDRLPRLVGESATLAGHWPAAGVETAYLLCPDAASVPPFAPPPQFTTARIVIGCHSIDDLPAWVRALPPNQRAWLTLDELNREELGNFLLARLGGPVSGSAFSDLGSSSGFVPGFLTEILRVLSREGILAQTGETWTLTAPIPADLFTSHVNNALAGFDAATRDLFLRLCLLGTAEPGAFTPAERDRIQQLARAGLVRTGHARHYAVLSRTLAEAGQLLVDPVAASAHFEAALDLPSPPEFSVVWALSHGQPVREAAVMAVIRAALDRHDWSRANSVAALALSQFSEEEDSLFLCDVLICQAVALRFMDDPEEALACLAHAEWLLADRAGSAAGPGCEAVRDDEPRSRIAIQRAEIRHFKLGQLDVALEGLSQARHQVQDARLRTKLAGEQVLHLIYGGRFREATAANESLAPELHRGHARTRTRIAIARCLQYVAEGEIQRGFNLALRIGARRLLQRGRQAWLVEEFSAAYFVSAFRLHPPVKLRTLMRRFEGQSAESFSPDDTSFRLARASWLLASGKVAEADREIAACHANMQFHDPTGLAQAVVALRAQTSALTGSRQTARSMMSAITTISPRTSAVIAGGCAAHLSAAEYLLGIPDAAERTLERAAAFIADGKFGFAAEVLHAGVRFGSPRVARQLIEIRERLKSPLVSLHVDHAAAVCANDPVALAEIGDRYQESGLLLLAAEAYGLALQHTGIPEIVERRAEHEQLRLLPTIGAIEHPLIRQPSGSTVVRLTKREQEVQELIVRGLSNRDIAQRLSLSPRTVEGHVSRLYQKTGRTRRDPRRRA